MLDFANINWFVLDYQTANTKYFNNGLWGFLLQVTVGWSVFPSENTVEAVNGHNGCVVKGRRRRGLY